MAHPHVVANVLGFHTEFVNGDRNSVTVVSPTANNNNRGSQNNNNNSDSNSHNHLVKIIGNEAFVLGGFTLL